MIVCGPAGARRMKFLESPDQTFVFGDGVRLLAQIEAHLLHHASRGVAHEHAIGGGAGVSPGGSIRVGFPCAAVAVLVLRHPAAAESLFSAEVGSFLL